MRDQQKHRTALLVRLLLPALFLLLVTLRPNWPQTHASMAEPTEPVSSLSAGPVEDGDTTISPSIVKTWKHFYYWKGSDYCDSKPLYPAFIKDSEIAAGSMVTGYKHFYDSGTTFFGCPLGVNYVYNGTVLFDLSEIIDKAPPLHVAVTSATLHFTQQSGSCPGEVRIANEIWWTGYPENALVPGGPFARIVTGLEYAFAKRALCESGECTLEVQTVVNNWVKGKKNGGYANFGFILKGIVDDDVHYKDEASCLARYGDFSLTVHYKYDKPPAPVPTPTPTPAAISIARSPLEDKIKQGEQSLNSRTDKAFGLITTTFDTLQGTVSVNLPDDVAAGDTISGTVITEPKGNTRDEQAQNQDSLNGYVVEVAKQETRAQREQVSKWVIPPVAQFIPVVLKNRNGEVVARTQVPVNQGTVVKPKPNGDYSTPPFGQAGRPISVAGPFDGDFNNTAVNLGNNTAQFLAESPRKVVVRSPANVIGAATIEVNEQNQVVARCHYQSIGVRLAAGKLNLIRGEQTTVTVTLSGLDGVTSPVPMQLTNASPATVRMEGGDTQTITAEPGQFTGGVFTARRTLTGIKPGGFAINAVVNPTILPAGAGGVWNTCSRAAPGPENLSRKTEAGQLTVSSSVADRGASDKLFRQLLYQKVTNDDHPVPWTRDDVVSVVLRY